MSIKKIISSFRNKDISSQRLLYEMFYKRVYNTAYLVTKDIHLADDVVQETFIKAFRNMDQISEFEKIGAWLSVIATRTAIDLLNKRKGHIITPVDPGILERELDKYHKMDEIDRISLKDNVRELIDQLSPEQRAVIILKYYHDMKDEEIASTLGLSVGTVKSRVSRAKDKMRQSIIASDRGDNYGSV